MKNSRWLKVGVVAKSEGDFAKILQLWRNDSSALELALELAPLVAFRFAASWLFAAVPTIHDMKRRLYGTVSEIHAINAVPVIIGYCT